MEGLDLTGLNEVIRKYEKTGKDIKKGLWQITKGVRKEFWQLSYRYCPVITCINYKLFNVDLSPDEYKRVCNVITGRA